MPITPACATRSRRWSMSRRGAGWSGRPEHWSFRDPRSGWSERYALAPSGLRPSPLPHHLQPFLLAQHLHAELRCLGELRARARAGNDIIGLLRHRSRGLGAEPLGFGLRLLARHLLERTGEHHGLAGDGGMPRRALGVEDAHLLGQPLDDAAVVLLAEIGP